MLLQNRFNQIDLQIVNLEEQIKQLQETLSNLQNQRQQLQSIEQACESALTQIDTAILMLSHVEPGEIATFKAAIDAKFADGVAAALPPPRS